MRKCNYRPKACVDCGAVFQPIGNRAKRCETCRVTAEKVASARWAAANLESRRASKVRYAATHREQLAAAQVRLRAADLERFRAADARRRAADLERYRELGRANAANQRARKRLLQMLALTTIVEHNL